MRRCSNCLMPDTRPRVTFTGNLCNACHFNMNDATVIDWEERRREFLDLIASKKAHPVYDCVVPFSGGKDSAAIAHKLKHGLGLNPLLVTYGQLLWTDVGRWNFHNVANAGLDILYWRTNQEVSRRLCRRFLIERGHPKAHYDAAINAIPVITAKQMGIPLVVYAEHGDTEYGGHILSERHRRERDLEEVLEHCVGDDARNWAVDGVTEKDLYPYIYPSDTAGLLAVYYSYFFPWDVYENALYAKKTMDFKQVGTAPNDALWAWGRSDGSFEGFDSIDDKIDGLDFYLMYLKFGFGRATRMASRMIKWGHITKEQGREWINRYDGEFPTMYIEDVLNYVGMGRSELEKVLESHRDASVFNQ